VASAAGRKPNVRRWVIICLLIWWGARRRRSAPPGKQDKILPAQAAPQAACDAVRRKDGKRYQCHRRRGHRGLHHADSGLAWGGFWRGTRTRARHYTDCPGRGGFKAVAALFLPGTLAPRLVFLFVILFSVAVFPIPEWLKVAFGVPAVAALIGAVYVIRELLGEWDPDPGTSTWDMTFATIWWVVALIGLYAIPAGLAFLVSLVGGGEGFAAAYQAKPYFQAGSVGWVEIVLVLATL
jgi:hypothetical protein